MWIFIDREYDDIVLCEEGLIDGYLKIGMLVIDCWIDIIGGSGEECIIVLVVKFLVLLLFCMIRWMKGKSIGVM